MRTLVRIIWFFETVTMLAAARGLIKLLPFRLWSRWAGPIARAEAAGSTEPSDPDKRERALAVGRWVTRLAKRMPFSAVCLPQALAARWMLNRRNIGSELFLGAQMNEDGDQANIHAWLMVGNICLTGAREREQFKAFQARSS